MLRTIVAVALLVASAVATPMEPRATGRPSKQCVLIEPSADDPGYIIDPWDRPQCACDCLKSACKSVTVRSVWSYPQRIRTDSLSRVVYPRTMHSA
jgi:hypothetical protein